jgi:cytochrome c-type biogenesis protein
MTDLAATAGLGSRSRGQVFLHALLFVGGFSLVFVVGWGGAATLLGELFGTYKSVLGKAGGVLVIAFGLYTMGLLPIPWLGMDTRPLAGFRPSPRLLQSSLFGILFAAGWTPCVGATLGAILTLGFSQQTAGQAMVLSSGYALGLGLPFQALAVFLQRALGVVDRLKRHMRTFQRVSGIFLLLIGVLMLTDRITWIAIWAQRNGLFLDVPLGGAAAPTYLAAVAAGALSVLSPCVLPLVPAYLGYLGGQALMLGGEEASRPAAGAPAGPYDPPPPTDRGR